ncbi:transposase [Micromonospora sp. NPDC049048]|uniref:transposase n=1 Tax=Micromonospora sp. NPDC049048 TaxID=3364263 RepID=UPI00371DE3F8
MTGTTRQLYLPWLSTLVTSHRGPVDGRSVELPNGICQAAHGSEVDPTELNDPEQATAAALAGLARRVTALTEEITTLDRQLTPLVSQAAPRTSALFGVGTEVAAQLLTTDGDNPDRLRSEAALAHLCRAAPIPASSGRVRRHRLHRGGDRGANHALHHRPLPPALRPTHPRLPATTHHRRPQQARNPPLPQALHRPRRLHRPTRRLRRPHPLTSIGASGWLGGGLP